jgi:hypothetical protein
MALAGCDSGLADKYEIQTDSAILTLRNSRFSPSARTPYTVKAEDGYVPTACNPGTTMVHGDVMDIDWAGCTFLDAPYAQHFIGTLHRDDDGRFTGFLDVDFLPDEDSVPTWFVLVPASGGGG